MCERVLELRPRCPHVNQHDRQLGVGLGLEVAPEVGKGSVTELKLPGSIVAVLLRALRHEHLASRDLLRGDRKRTDGALLGGLREANQRTEMVAERLQALQPSEL